MSNVVFHLSSSSVKGRLSLKVVFYERLSSVKGHLPPKVVFRLMSSFVKGCLPLKVIFCLRSFSVKGRLPSKVVFRQRSSSAKGRLLSKVVFRQSSSSVNGRLPSKVIICHVLICHYNPSCKSESSNYKLDCSDKEKFGTKFWGGHTGSDVDNNHKYIRLQLLLRQAALHGNAVPEFYRVIRGN